MKHVPLILILFAAISCGSKKNSSPPSKVTPEQKEALLTLKNQTLDWARECSMGIACGSLSDGTPDDGDSTLWAGLLCLSGDYLQCRAVRASIGSDGSIHRNPDQDRDKNSASRDMMMGVLAYLAKTKDKLTGDLVHNYIVNNNYKLCSDATDNRCNFNQPQYNAGWNLWHEIWNYHGYQTTKQMEIGKKYGGDFIVNIQSIFASEGYPKHLVAVELLIHQYVGDWSLSFQNSANRLASNQPHNPFFEYVANGPTMKAAQLVLDKCPREQPIRSNDWAWQRDESEKAWSRSKGWDCIFMVNLLTQEASND